jgi:hypothetical protein
VQCDSLETINQAGPASHRVCRFERPSVALDLYLADVGIAQDFSTRRPFGKYPPSVGEWKSGVEPQWGFDEPWKSAQTALLH